MFRIRWAVLPLLLATGCSSTSPASEDQQLGELPELPVETELGPLTIEQPIVDATVGGLAIGGRFNQRISQSFLLETHARIEAVEVAAGCDSGVLRVEIYRIEAREQGDPVFFRADFEPSALARRAPGEAPTLGRLTFPEPLRLPPGLWALVLSNPDGSCGCFRGPEGDSYPDGSLEAQDEVNAMAWVSASRGDLPFRIVGTALAAGPTGYEEELFASLDESVPVSFFLGQSRVDPDSGAAVRIGGSAGRRVMQPFPLPVSPTGDDILVEALDLPVSCSGGKLRVEIHRRAQADMLGQAKGELGAKVVSWEFDPSEIAESDLPGFRRLTFPFPLRIQETSQMLGTLVLSNPDGSCDCLSGPIGLGQIERYATADEQGVWGYDPDGRPLAFRIHGIFPH